MEKHTEVDEDLIAVRQAISEWRTGDAGVPLDEAFRQLRSRTTKHTKDTKREPEENSNAE